MHRLVADFSGEGEAHQALGFLAKASGDLRLLTGWHVHIDILRGLPFTASLPSIQIPLRHSYVASRDRILIDGMSPEWPKSVVLVRQSYCIDGTGKRAF